MVVFVRKHAVVKSVWLTEIKSNQSPNLTHTCTVQYQWQQWQPHNICINKTFVKAIKREFCANLNQLHTRVTYTIYLLSRTEKRNKKETTDTPPFNTPHTLSLKCTSTYLPNRLLLMFLIVLALPNDSRRGFAAKRYKNKIHCVTVVIYKQMTRTIVIKNYFFQSLHVMDFKCHLTSTCKHNKHQILIAKFYSIFLHNFLCWQ